MKTISEKLKEIGYKSFIAADHYPSETLKNLSELIGRRVPDDYLRFLVEFPNTGTIGDEIVCEGITASPWAPNGFYSIALLYASCSNSLYDLVINHRNPADAWDFGGNFLVIGDDVGGNLFCLDLKEESFGKIYFWDHEHLAAESGLYLVANDFTSFVNGFREFGN